MWYEDKYKEIKEYVELITCTVCAYFKYPKRIYIKYIN